MSDSQRPVTPRSATVVQHGPPTAVLGPHDIPFVPGYELARVIAGGGMGTVYAARDPVFGREVAVKVMHPGQDAGRFVVESKITAQLPHPGVPPVYALGRLPDGRPFLAMKLIQGHTLADELRVAKRADVPRLLGAFESICQTVGFAHSRGIIHRDLKPANVMVGAFGEVLVLDWGLAKPLDDNDGAEGVAATLRPRSEIAQQVTRGAGGELGASADTNETRAGTIKGTPAYMAPEQARGEPVDARADVFALGGILAAILTGNPPFVGDSVMDTVLRASQADLGECFEELDACGTDAELVAAAKRALAPHPDGRFRNGAEVAAAIAAYRAGVEDRLRTAERDRAAAEAKATEGRKRRRVQLALAAAVALLACGGAAFAWWEKDRRGRRALAEAENRATEARLAGERDAEARNKAEQARRGIDRALKLAADLRGQYKFKPAAAALDQATELAPGAPELGADVERARRDLAFVVELAAIRMNRFTRYDVDGVSGLDDETAAAAYRAAFRARGLDPADPAALGRAVAASAVRRELVAALDDWAIVEPDAGAAARLLDAARRADPGAWTDRFRDPTARADPAELDRLARTAEPRSLDPAVMFALADLMRRRDRDAGELLAAAQLAHPDDFLISFALGEWWVIADPRRAVGHYRAARALLPDSRAALFNLRYVLYPGRHHTSFRPTRADAAEALACAAELVRLDPNDAGAHDNLGYMYGQTGDFVRCVAHYREAIRLDPAYRNARRNLLSALSDVRIGTPADVIAAARDWIVHGPQAADPYLYLARGLRESGDAAGARDAARQATQLAPNDPDGHSQLAFALADTGDADGALAAARQAVKLDGQKEKSYTAVGYALAAAGDTDAAIAEYRRALGVKEYYRARHYLGRAYEKKGQLDTALEHYRRAAELQPGYAAARTDLDRLQKRKVDTPPPDKKRP